MDILPMNNVDRNGIVHSDPLHVQRPNPDIQNVTPNGDAIPGASSWSLTQIIDGLATKPPYAKPVECTQDAEPSRPADYGDRIASDVLRAHAIQPHFVRTGEQLAILLAEAARLGYEMGYGAQ